MNEPYMRRRRDSQSSAVMVERLISRRTALGLLGASAAAHVAGCGSPSSTPPTLVATSDVHYLTLVDIGRRIASREVSPVDVTERMLDRIGRIDPALKSYATVMSEDAREAARAREYGPYMREFLSAGARVTPQQLAAARERRAALTTQWTAVLESVDAVAGPAGGDPAWPITHALQVGSLPEYHKAWSAAHPRSAEFTMPMDLAGVPTICVPCGFSSDGLPYSIQFTGRHLAEATLCRIAYAYEQTTAWHTRHPNVNTA